jgi:hypothetical protein
MKQRITVGQLRELTEEQKQRLRDWWLGKADFEGNYIWHEKSKTMFTYGNGCEYEFDDKIFTQYYWDEQRSSDMIKTECLPLLSIGQMIELIECEDYAGIEYYYIEKDGKEICRLYTHSKGYEADNLCDCLWSAVKEVL